MLMSFSFFFLFQVSKMHAHQSYSNYKADVVVACMSEAKRATEENQTGAYGSCSGLMSAPG